MENPHQSVCYDYVDDRIFGGEDQRFWSHTTTHTTLSKTFDTKLAPSTASELRWGQRIKTAPVGCAGSSALHRKDENWGIVAVIWLLPQTKLSSLASSRSVNKLLSPLGLRRLNECPFKHMRPCDFQLKMTHGKWNCP